MSGRMNGQRAVLTAAVARLYQGQLPSPWMELDPLWSDLLRVVQPAIAIRETEAERVRRWRWNNRKRWLRTHPGATEVPESVSSVQAQPRFKQLSLEGQERSGRNTIVRKTLNNKRVFERKTVNGVRYIRLLSIPGPLRRDARFRVK